jgi:hypothetical protein
MKNRGVARDLDAFDPARRRSVVGRHPSGHQVVGHVPRDEERQVRPAHVLLEAGSVPADLTAVGSGTQARLHLEAQTGRRGIDVGVGDAELGPMIAAVGGEGLEGPAERRGLGDRRIDHGDQLEVVAPQRDDPVRGAPPRVDTTGHRRETEGPQDPRARFIQVAHRQHRMIDREHRSTFPPSSNPHGGMHAVRSEAWPADRCAC